ncbi:transcriptional regulator [Oxalobacter paraformigenes]|uniref:Uncharacterized protein n=1 Tax=Oxalobacter paraformigenes TaxID=556268 RepID=C3X1S2_9BURK|nr:YdaS family helix-turn-helix protein [Oxalobacter paraformigenes]EEO27158.1 hypothetical protein OFAG_00311 [Oxalobacter paraformigenes]
MIEEFNKAIQICGGLTKLSRAIDMPVSFAWQIKEGKSRLPEGYGRRIFDATHGAVSLKKMFPDSWMNYWTARDIEFMEKEARERTEEEGE